MASTTLFIKCAEKTPLIDPTSNDRDLALPKLARPLRHPLLTHVSFLSYRSACGSSLYVYFTEALL